MRDKTCYMIMDLQYGSTGKGLLAGYLAKRLQPDTVVTAWAANAGHTFIDHAGRKFVHTMLANGIVSPKLQQLLIGPGSVIDPYALDAELTGCMDILAHAGCTILIHPHAAIITPQHRQQESTFHAIGSTKKGVGAAAIQRIQRDPAQQNIAKIAIGSELMPLVCTVDEYNNAMDAARVIQIESAQGHSLSMYHGFYPYCTSRDVSTAQTMADCGLPWHWLTEVMGTLRTYPIRVANRFNDAGDMIGFSGPWYPDQVEIEWEDIGLKAELTTVTKLPRRIATFSYKQITEAVRQTGATSLFLNFANYLLNEAAVIDMVNRIHDELDVRDIRGPNGDRPRVEWLGFGPTEDHVRMMHHDNS